MSPGKGLDCRPSGFTELTCSPRCSDKREHRLRQCRAIARPDEDTVAVVVNEIRHAADAGCDDREPHGGSLKHRERLAFEDRGKDEDGVPRVDLLEFGVTRYLSVY